jgi:hypothetical protein
MRASYFHKDSERRVEVTVENIGLDTIMHDGAA